MAANFFLDNPDLRFHLAHLPWDELVTLTELDPNDADAFKTGKDAREAYEQVLEAIGAFSANEVAPHWKELDLGHPTFADGEVEDTPRVKQIMKGLAEMGAMGVSLPRRLGGMSAPLVVEFALMEVLGRADTAIMSHFGFHGGIAASLHLYCLEEGTFSMEKGSVTRTRFDEPIRKMASGQEWGAMVLTEAGAGSDLGQLRTTAKLAPDGTWRLNGSKIFITSGHGEHHIVIARSEDPVEAPGLKGLSLFYVPAHIEVDGKRVRNVQVGGIEHKMGQHAGVAATLHYEDSRGELIGQRRHGFRQMLLLMNNARLAVGFQSLGVMEAAHRLARDYAEQRVTMGKAIAQHEMVAEILDDMDLSIRGLRALCFAAAYHQEAAERLKMILKLAPPSSKDELDKMQRRMRRHGRKARHMTPLIKYFAGEQSVHVTRMGMQVFGGPGYIHETGAERLLRDALVLPIYEGTSQIQSLMALKDNLQDAIRNPGRFIGLLANTRVTALSERDPLQRGQARMQAMAHGALQAIATRIVRAKFGDLRDVPIRKWRHALVHSWDPQKDFSFGLLHAERLTKILAAAAIADVLVEQAEAVRGTPDEAERRYLAERWIGRWEPRCRGIMTEIEASAEANAGQRAPKHQGNNGDGAAARP